MRWRALRTALERSAAILALGCSLLLPRAAHSGPETLPPQHWAYSELEHFEARGFVHLPAARPYSRTQVRVWVEALQAHAGDCAPGERRRLARLVDEFVDGDAALAQRDDPPLVDYSQAPWSVTGDVELRGGALAARGGGDPQTSWGRGRLETTLRYGEHLVYDTRYRVTVEEETGLRSGENHLSSRERNWHGLTSDNDRAYLALEHGALRVSLGRDFTGWGARRNAELLVSDAGNSLDAFGLRLRLGRFELSSVAAMLSASQNRYYAAHRLDTDLGPVQVGVQEVAVFQSPHFDPTYLFPISFYYGNQFNERADDNVLLGGDVKWITRAGVVDAELLVDDFIYDGDPAPQKIGWRLGATSVLPWAGRVLEVRGGYERLNRWTFTHRTTSAQYVAGTGDLARGEPFLGTPLGPDADRLRAVLSWTPGPRGGLWGAVSATRRGDGNRDRSAWIPGTAYALPFPSGVVERTRALEAGGNLRLGRKMELWGAVALEDASGDRRARLETELRLDL